MPFWSTKCSNTPAKYSTHSLCVRYLQTFPSLCVLSFSDFNSMSLAICVLLLSFGICEFMWASIGLWIPQHHIKRITCTHKNTITIAPYITAANRTETYNVALFHFNQPFCLHSAVNTFCIHANEFGSLECHSGPANFIYSSAYLYEKRNY